MKIIESLLLLEYFVLTVCDLRVTYGHVSTKPHTIWGIQNDHGDQPDQLMNTKSKRSIFKCGVHGQEPTIDSLSTETKLPGEWPWVVAVVLSRGKEFIYLCGGSLIHNRFAITAGLCIYGNHTNKQMEAKDVAITVGVREISEPISSNDKGNIRFLTAMFLHEEYDSHNNRNNIALLVLKEPVTYSKLVKPVCLWEGEDNQDDLEKAIQHGTVIGWDWSELLWARTTVLRRFNMSIISYTTCRKLNMVDKYGLNEKNFCAVQKGTKTFCSGLGGDGLYVEQHGRWMLRGMVSAALQKDGICGTTICTDVAKHRNWISATAYRWSLTSMSECGVQEQKPPIDSLLAETTLPGEWPWAVAVFHSNDKAFTYQCSASLIDNRFAITAAHCIYDYNALKQMDTEKVIIIVGVRDVLHSTFDEGSTRLLTAIYRHEEYDSETNVNNIALLVLKEPITYTKFVKAVCLWDGEDGQDELEKTIQSGTMVGWSEIDWAPRQRILQRLNMSIISSIICRELNMDYTNKNTEKPFCAVNKGAKMICRDFSGSGLYIEQHGRWRLRGMFSRPVLRNDTCDGTAVFTDVAKYIYWISETTYLWSQTSIMPVTASTHGTGNNLLWTQQCSKRYDVNKLVTGGQSTREGEWPWHVAIYHNEHTGSSSLNRYRCGGSLISASHVLTAAHCFIDELTNRPVGKRSINILLGTHNIKSFSDAVQFKLVDRLEIHPEYNYEREYKDIALLMLSSPVEFTGGVRPVCLWPEDKVDLSHIVGKNGSVVGWGNDEYGLLTDELMLAELPVVSELTCLRSHIFYHKYTNNFTFCAGQLRTTSVCNGDSGGGMVFKLRSGDFREEWFLRGLVSLRRATEKPCDPSHYVIFTDVAKYLDWIKDSVSRDL